MNLPVFDVPQDAYTGRYVVGQGNEDVIRVVIYNDPCKVLISEGYTREGDILGEYILATLHDLLTGFEMRAAREAARTLCDLSDDPPCMSQFLSLTRANLEELYTPVPKKPKLTLERSESFPTLPPSATLEID